MYASKDVNDKLISKINEDYIAVQRFLGRPLFRGEGYIKQVPDSPSSEGELIRIKENIRSGLYSLLIYYFFEQNNPTEAISWEIS